MGLSPADTWQGLRKAVVGGLNEGVGSPCDIGERD